ncbi:MAG: hypothetical protein EAX96_02630 [Candidatus Lokiarchaeota archaeon]|nr:hypothetical protein [Candidatus Lokiarchaeota archaeon]
MYETLLKLWDKENDKESLNLLPKDFRIKIHSHVEKLQQIMNSYNEESIEKGLIENEIHEFMQLLSDFLKIRLNKLICLTIEGIEIEKSHLMVEEKKLIESFKSALAIFYDSFNVKSDQNEMNTNIIESSANLVVIRILEDIEEMVGIDLKNYGPFKKEDIATIPEKNAITLIEKNAAMLIKSN